MPGLFLTSPASFRWACALGKPARVSVSGVNLGDSHQVDVHPPKWADGWTTLPLEMKNGQASSLNKVTLAVGNEPEILEREPNDTPAHAQVISLPVTINGHIDAGAKAGGKSDEDYFRFHAKKGQSLGIQVAAARLGSPLDSVIEVLDAQGNPIPRATVRCQNQTIDHSFRQRFENNRYPAGIHFRPS